MTYKNAAARKAASQAVIEAGETLRREIEACKFASWRDWHPHKPQASQASRAAFAAKAAAEKALAEALDDTRLA